MMATRFGISPPKAVGTTRSGGDYTVKINTVVGIIRVVYIYIYIYILLARVFRAEIVGD